MVTKINKIIERFKSYYLSSQMQQLTVQTRLMWWYTPCWGAGKKTNPHYCTCQRHKQQIGPCGRRHSSNGGCASLFSTRSATSTLTWTTQRKRERIDMLVRGCWRLITVGSSVDECYSENEDDGHHKYWKQIVQHSNMFAFDLSYILLHDLRF